MSEPTLSKRERQKQRREAKLAQQRAQEAKSRRLRIAVFAAIGVVFAGLIGLAIQRQAAERARLAEQEAAVQARLDDLGCTPDESMEDRGQGHLEAAALASSPPDTLYPDRPATSGTHYSNWLITGVYDELIDERALIHNLEHGYVVSYYSQDAPADQIDEYKQAAQEHIDGNYPKLIVAPWDGALPEGANFAYVAWGQRQLCQQFDADVFELFVRSHHSSAGDAPERTLPPHLTADQGIDPEGEPFLLPPLGEDTAPEGMDEDDPVPTEGVEADGPTEGTS